MLQIPIFHVNGEDPEAVARAVRIALEYRALFRCDAVIDMYCYRRRGHNEGDEPRFTQPDLYAEIDKRKTVRDGFLDRLIERESVTREEADAYSKKSIARLEAEFERAQAGDEVPAVDTLGGVWTDYYGGPDAYQDEPETALPLAELQALGDKITAVPEGFHVLSKLDRILEQRRAALAGEREVDWALAESLAFASLAAADVRVRLTGQDSERGTFSHRHAVWHDVETAETYSPFTALKGRPVEIANSPLSEMSVVGFEYGYSLDMPEALVGWEAQFGDFVNCAQVIIDQFLVSAEDKWRRLSGLMMLLPHGFEGQGPEHSSARLERFLTLAAEDNIQIAQPTTAAQYFHLLRRHVLRKWRKPLIVMTPKSLLRKREAGSQMDDLTSGSWQRILPDPSADAASATTVLLCTGKVAFDLLAQRPAGGRHAIVRLEQIYPLGDRYFEEVLARYPQATEVVWVQEEPANMGAWPYIHHRFGDTLLGLPLHAVTRHESASPATGSSSTHRREQQELISAALGLTGDEGVA
jgi:2-oxoglutarate dehydrogenase E1 component